MGSFFLYIRGKVRARWAELPPGDRPWWVFHFLLVLLLLIIQLLITWFAPWFPVEPIASFPLPMGEVMVFTWVGLVRVLFLAPLGLVLRSRARLHLLRADWQQRPERPLLRLLHCISAASPVGRLVTSLELLLLLPMAVSRNFGGALLAWLGFSMLWLLLLLLVHVEEPVADLGQLGFGVIGARLKELTALGIGGGVAWLGHEVREFYQFREQLREREKRHREDQEFQATQRQEDREMAERNHQFTEYHKTLRGIRKSIDNDLGQHRALLEAGKLKGNDYVDLVKSNDEIRKILIERSSSPTIVPRGGSDLPANPPK